MYVAYWCKKCSTFRSTSQTFLAELVTGWQRVQTAFTRSYRQVCQRGFATAAIPNFLRQEAAGSTVTRMTRIFTNMIVAAQHPVTTHNKPLTDARKKANMLRQKVCYFSLLLPQNISLSTLHLNTFHCQAPPTKELYGIIIISVVSEPWLNVGTLWHYYQLWLHFLVFCHFPENCWMTENFALGWLGSLKQIFIFLRDDSCQMQKTHLKCSNTCQRSGLRDYIQTDSRT